MCISAWLTARYNSRHDYPFGSVRARVRYILFCSIWTIVMGIIFLVFFFVSSLGSVMTSVAAHFILYVSHIHPQPASLTRKSLDSLIITFILWVAAAAAITEALGGGLSCSHQNYFTYCGQLNAVEGFAWLIWCVPPVTISSRLSQALTRIRP